MNALHTLHYTYAAATEPYYTTVLYCTVVLLRGAVLQGAAGTGLDCRWAAEVEHSLSPSKHVFDT